MISFEWHRHDHGPKHGILWTLHHAPTMKEVGRCFFLKGSRHYRCSAAAPVRDGVVLTDYYGGTAASARRHLEGDWCKRSIGLFGEDDIQFVVAE